MDKKKLRYLIIVFVLLVLFCSFLLFLNIIVFSLYTRQKSTNRSNSIRISTVTISSKPCKDRPKSSCFLTTKPKSIWIPEFRSKGFFSPPIGAWKKHDHRRGIKVFFDPRKTTLPGFLARQVIIDENFDEENSDYPWEDYDEFEGEEEPGESNLEDYIDWEWYEGEHGSDDDDEEEKVEKGDNGPPASSVYNWGNFDGTEEDPSKASDVYKNLFQSIEDANVADSKKEKKESKEPKSGGDSSSNVGGGEKAREAKKEKIGKMIDKQYEDLDDVTTPGVDPNRGEEYDLDDPPFDWDFYEQKLREFEEMEKEETEEPLPSVRFFCTFTCNHESEMEEFQKTIQFIVFSDTFEATTEEEVLEVGKLECMGRAAASFKCNIQDGFRVDDILVGQLRDDTFEDYDGEFSRESRQYSAEDYY